MNINDIKKIQQEADLIYNQQQVQTAFATMAENISLNLADSNPLCLGVMVGGMVACGQLMPYLNFPLELDYIHATRYRNKTQGHTLKWIKYPAISLENRVVLVIDDILDKGITLAEIKKWCYIAGAKKVFTVVLADKNCERANNGLKVTDFYGLKIPNRYVFGYGLDYHGYLRNANGIFAVKDL
jgi:hypoxanthine phosphoribosyltransferase